MDQNIKKCTKCDSELVKVDGIYALTRVEKTSEGLTFFPASGVPIIVYICPKCGKVEIFSAKLLGEI